MCSSQELCMSSSSRLTRREFLVRSGKVAAATVLTTGIGFALHEKERHPFTEKSDDVFIRDLRIPNIERQLVVVHGNDPSQMTRAALQKLKGINTFIQRGDKVVIKPNIGWDRIPEQAANTNPEVIRTLVRECLAAGASRVVVADVTCNDMDRCYFRSGIMHAAVEAGAVIERPVEAHFHKVNMGGAMLGTQLVYKTFLEADKFINVPIAKHHSLTGTTLGMKNLYGILGGNRSRLHQDIHNSLADLGNFLRPTLTIIDAFRILKRNGPQGGNLADVEEKKTLIASTDQVAIDAYAGEIFFGLSVEQLRYLTIAEKRGLGTSNYKQLPLHEISV